MLRASTFPAPRSLPNTQYPCGTLRRPARCVVHRGNHVICPAAGAGVGGRERSLEKLRISLPRVDSINRRSRPRIKPWNDFASQALKTRSDSQSPPPPPLPPRAPSTVSIGQSQCRTLTIVYSTQMSRQTPPSTWINFDEVPEKRKAPVRIQTIPSRGSIVSELSSRPPGASCAAGAAVSSGAHHHVHYVDPEDCRCECHESEHRPTPPPGLAPGGVPCSSAPGSAPARPPKARPFGMDLDVSGSCSNRSSVASQVTITYLAVLTLNS